MSDLCQRCNKLGEDRRTLWMACFYAMDEMSIPFDKKLLFSADKDADFEIVKEGVSITTKEGTKIALTSPAVKCNSNLYPEQLFTLRVCKRCRAEWMQAIKDWFERTPEGQDHDADDYNPNYVGSGIFILENGSIKEITEEEWYRRNPGKEPVRYSDG